MNTEARNRIRQRWLLALFEFAHLDYQRRLWIESSYHGLVGSAQEAFSQYFDDLDLVEGYDKFIQERVITWQEAMIVKEFHDLLSIYTNQPEKINLSDKNILKDVEWINLSKLAKVCWDNLKIEIGDTKEIEYMKSLEKQYLFDK